MEGRELSTISAPSSQAIIPYPPQYYPPPQQPSDSTAETVIVTIAILIICYCCYCLYSSCATSLNSRFQSR